MLFQSKQSFLVTRVEYLLSCGLHSIFCHDSCGLSSSTYNAKNIFTVLVGKPFLFNLKLLLKHYVVDNDDE